MLFNKKRVLSPKCSPKQDQTSSHNNPPKIVHRTATRTPIVYQSYIQTATKTGSADQQQQHPQQLGLLPKSASMALESPHSSLEGAVFKTLLKQGGMRNAVGVSGGNSLISGSQQPSNSSSTLTRTKQLSTAASAVLKRQNFTPVPSLSNKKRHCSPSQTLYQQLSSLEKQSSSYNLSQLNSRKEQVTRGGTLTPSASFTVRTPCTVDRQVEGNLIRQATTATAVDDPAGKTRREETSTEERLLENDFSLPDELHYQQLDKCTDSTSILQPAVQQSPGIFQSHNFVIGQKVSIGCSPLSIDHQQKFLQPGAGTAGACTGSGTGTDGRTGRSGKRNQLLTKSLNFNPRKLFAKDTQQSRVLKRRPGSYISKNNSHNSKSPHGTKTNVSSTGAASQPSSTCFPASRYVMNNINKNDSATPPSNAAPTATVANGQHQRQGKLSQQRAMTTTAQQRQPQLSSCSGNSTKMSQKIIQLLKSSDVLRSAAQTPGAEPSLRVLETATTATKRVPYNSKMRKLACQTTAKKNAKLTTVPKCQVNLVCNNSSSVGNGGGRGSGKINHHAYTGEKRSTQQLSPSISSPTLQQTTLKPSQQSLQLPFMSSAPIDTPSMPPTMNSFLENTPMRASSSKPFEDEDESATPVKLDKSPFGEPVQEEIQQTPQTNLHHSSSQWSHRKSQVLLPDAAGGAVGTQPPIKSSFREQLKPESSNTGGAIISPLNHHQKRQQMIGLSPLQKWHKSASNKKDSISSGRKQALSSFNNDYQEGGDFTPSQDDDSKKATLLMNLQKIDTGQVYQAAPSTFNSNTCFFSGNQVVANSAIPKKEGDSGLECSIEDPSPVTPKSVTTFTQQQKGGLPTTMDLPTQPYIYLDKKAQSQQEDKSTPSGNQGFIDTDNSQKLKPYLKQIKRQILEQQQCLNTDPGNNSAHGEKVCRVITFEGHEVIGEASELTKSMSNVLQCGNGRPSDFTKHLLAYEEKRQRQEQQIVHYQPMPFEIAESQRDKPPFQKSQASLLFADNRILFDEISQLPSEVQGLSQKESASITGMLKMLQQQPTTSTIQASAHPKKQHQVRRYPAMKKSNSQLIFRGDADVMSRREGNPSVAHQLRQTYAMSTHRRSSNNQPPAKQQQQPFAQQQQQQAAAVNQSSSLVKSFDRQRLSEGRPSKSQVILVRRSDGNGRR